MDVVGLATLGGVADGSWGGLGNITIHQVLAVKQSARGGSGLPATRGEWLGDVR
ncbi:MAG: hypothetical protein F2911_11855 [Actinobacteria bacterium]|uniref:Unannotated protein n=1 Tax=freshwater metagenome TaxID=449393 RepID=A0A6J7SIW4_9ZZZZ|nr:hypothetical protein [Actinomycetota bacterium]